MLFTELKITGETHAAHHVNGETIRLKGQLNVKGDCEAERFLASGAFDITGLLSAEDIDVKLHGNAQAKEIGGNKITVRKSPFRLFTGFFMHGIHASLTVEVIEGNDIYLEYTKATTVRGNTIEIGPGCEIDEVEYKTHFKQTKDAIVKSAKQA